MTKRKRLIALLVLLLGLAYPLGARASWLFPANPGWRPPAQGVRVLVMSNGVHTGIAMPAVAPLWDWRPRLGLRTRPGAWLWFGWGQRDFYMATPRWRDVRPLPVLRALLGSERTLMHVDALWEPATGADARIVVLRPAEARRLVRAIEAGFAAGGRALPGYGRDDAFWPGTGRYSGLHTCNNWTGDMLRAAGVRVGRWTPTAGSVLAGF